jgi:hypothetical protein
MNLPWYFDYISPFAYLQWQRLKPLRAGLGIEAVPILFAAVLDHHGHKGPAEIVEKRTFSYRFVQFEAERRGVPLRFPTLAIDAELFWGDDATAMALAYHADRELFSRGEYPRIGALPTGVVRKSAQ